MAPHQNACGPAEIPVDILFLSSMEQEFYGLLKEIQLVLAMAETNETLQRLAQLIAPIENVFEQRRVGISVEQVMQSAQQEFRALDRATIAARRARWPIGHHVDPNDFVTWLTYEATKIEGEAAGASAQTPEAQRRDWGKYAATLRAYSAWMFLLGAHINAEFSYLLHEVH